MSTCVERHFGRVADREMEDQINPGTWQ